MLLGWNKIYKLLIMVIQCQVSNWNDCTDDYCIIKIVIVYIFIQPVNLYHPMYLQSYNLNLITDSTTIFRVYLEMLLTYKTTQLCWWAWLYSLKILCFLRPWAYESCSHRYLWLVIKKSFKTVSCRTSRNGNWAYIL